MIFDTVIDEYACMSAMGVPFVQARETPKWVADPSMKFRDIWLTWVSLYHQRPWTHPATPPTRRASASSPKRNGR